ncbi:uncharacterized protein BJ171DRAFT_499875 [Polychytrium aggregatum]|uniref:uncharacterized protein n=1 Tax=Polychytrium aggregatum TaxID=110093 RepID=UPI0022FE55C8|nr:uncharacterized protein BJ171DRAFT_499875 [Polychytrium aggregatum]KAI9205841.1 hypothetical protein BJ171DRAFT_499875 [Polychytrium aggregatum]
MKLSFAVATLLAALAASSSASSYPDIAVDLGNIQVQKRDTPSSTWSAPASQATNSFDSGWWDCEEVMEMDEECVDVSPSEAMQLSPSNWDCTEEEWMDPSKWDCEDEPITDWDCEADFLPNTGPANSTAPSSAPMVSATAIGSATIPLSTWIPTSSPSPSQSSGSGDQSAVNAAHSDAPPSRTPPIAAFLTTLSVLVAGAIVLF